MSIASDARGSPRSDFFEGAKGLPFTENQRFSPSATLTRFEQELAYYRADEPYLPVEKCAQRCAALSVLLTATVRAGGRRPLDFAPPSALH